MKFPLPLAALAFSAQVQAQSIDAYRYWYDDAASTAVTTTVASTTMLALSTALPTGGMVAGHHRVSFQFRDTDGNWSSPQTTVFTRSGTTVSGYRYWLNDDPATMVNGTVTSGTSIDLDAELATNTSTRPFDLMTIQFRDADGLFSTPITKAFVRGTGQVNGYEYWIDDAIDDRVTNTIGPAGMVDLIADLPVPTSEGDHVFTIRFSSVNGAWSVPLSSTFSHVVGMAELPGISDLLLFPNPATDQLGLRMNSAEGHTLRLDILDISGRQVHDLGVWGVHGTTWNNWDISGLAPGSYLLRVTDGPGAWTTRFVKQ